VERSGPGVVYVIDDYLCTVRGGRLVAGDDAADVGWFDVLADPPVLVDGLLDALVTWGCVTPPGSGGAPSR
jgi:hypothetical protein